MDAEDDTHVGSPKAHLDLGTFFKNQDTVESYCCRFCTHMTFLFVLCLCPGVEVRGHLRELVLFFHLVGCTRDGIQVGRLGCRHLCLLSHLAGSHKHMDALSGAF